MTANTTQVTSGTGVTYAGQQAPRRWSWLNVVPHLDPRYGGISAVLPSFCQALSEEGRQDVSIAAFCAPDEMFTQPSGIAVERFPAGLGTWLRDGKLHRQLRDLVRQSDGVHIHGLWQEHCLYAAKFARESGRPYVIAAHGMLDPWALRNKQWKKQLYSWLVEKRNVSRAGCLHALTAAEASDYRKFGARSPVAVIPNGVEIPPDADSGRFFERFPELRGKRIVLFLGRIHFKKGLDILCRAWKQVDRDDVHLVLAGPDFEGTRAQVETLIADLGIGRSITWAGMLRGEEKWAALAACDLFVLPSYSEGLSVSVLEAMGLGRPVLVTEQCNVPEVATAGCGWMIQPDAEQLAIALKEFLAASPGALHALGSQGAAVVKRQYSWPRVASQMAAVYEWLLGGALPAAVDFRTGK